MGASRRRLVWVRPTRSTGSIARITAREDALPPFRPMTGHAADLRVLTEYRDQLVNERTATANRVHTDLLWLRPG